MSFPATEEAALAAGYVLGYTTTCLACGKPIRFFKTPKGKHIPMNAGPKFESHFATCPAASSFRKARAN
jgi:hypothetical protein